MVRNEAAAEPIHNPVLTPCFHSLLFCLAVAIVMHILFMTAPARLQARPDLRGVPRLGSIMSYLRRWDSVDPVIPITEILWQIVHPWWSAVATRNK